MTRSLSPAELAGMLEAFNNAAPTAIVMVEGDCDCEEGECSGTTRFKQMVVGARLRGPNLIVLEVEDL